MRIALISMPFVSITRPSIQLGLLSAIVKKYGFSVDTFHFNLELASDLGVELYQELATHRGLLYGDWLFSKAAFQEEAPKFNDNFLHQLKSTVERELSSIENPIQTLEKIRKESIPNFLERLMDETNWEKYSVIGFSSTFQQNTASFALTRKIKEKYPDKIIVFGGANFDGKMGIELTRKLDFIDYAVIGEGDVAFPQFLKAINEGSNPLNISGVYSKNKSIKQFEKEPKKLASLNESPIPDYDEYFQRLKKLELVENLANIRLPFESSRGCWWGEKHHCTFCGLNADTMAYRDKNADAVFKELFVQSQKYEVFDFDSVDNIINMKYTRDLLPKLEESENNLSIFYETKANINRSQLEAFVKAGINQLQPGIESLSTNVLKLMNKGVRGIQNVNFLRWCRYYGIDVGWNILWGFPKETEEDYTTQNALINKIYHLQPPVGGGRVWMERFSPMFFDKENFPVKFIHPAISYKYIYPSSLNLEEIAYFFDYEFENYHEDNFYDNIKNSIGDWKKAWQGQDKSELVFKYVPELIRIEDKRKNYEHNIYTIKDLPAEVYKICSNKQKTPNSILKELNYALSLENVNDILNEFCELDLMIKEDEFYLSLAIPNSIYSSIR